jgi:hypothetical protein
MERRRPPWLKVEPETAIIWGATIFATMMIGLAVWYMLTRGG